MKKWGSSTPKRTVVYSNDASIVRFQTSKLTKEQRKGCRQLVKRSIGKDGKPKFSGNKFLKRSECLSFNEKAFSAARLQSCIQILIPTQAISPRVCATLLADL